MKTVLTHLALILLGVSSNAFGRELRGDVSAAADEHNLEASAAQNLVYECFYLFPHQKKKLTGIEHLNFNSDSGQLYASGTCVFDVVDP